MKDETGPLDERLARRASESFVGRRDEMEALRALLAPEGPVAVHLFGIAGMGKSTLLAHLADEARQAGSDVLLTDCRQIEPTSRGFLGELSRQTAVPLESIADFRARIGKSPRVFLLALDNYESFLLMDTWLRQEFLPAMPAGFRLAIASRQPPVPLWLTSPAWHGLFRAIAVEPLGHHASLALLGAAGLEGERAAHLAAVTHGNPLALKLAASAALAHRTVTVQDAAIQEVMQELTSLFLADVADAPTRDAVRFCSVTRRITRSLLRALELDDEELFEKLQRLPFVEACGDGLRIHDAVREAIARTLRASDPERHAGCRRQTWLQLGKELDCAPRADIWRYTADMLYLIENPVVREAFFPSGQRQLAVEMANDADREAVHTIAARHEGEEAAAVLDGWWKETRNAFRVVRNRDGKVVAFYCMCLASDLPAAVRDADPVARAWCDHLQADPVGEEDCVLFLRRWLAASIGEAPAAEQAACWLDIKRTYMELRPALKRVYLTVVDLATYAPVATQLGFRHLADAARELDGARYETAMLDFGPASVDGWLTRLVRDELGVVDTGLLDRTRCALRLNGGEVPLTPLEYKLAAHLESQPEVTVTRDQLLEHVWGHSNGSGSSNVVDAVVKTLRRKMGTESSRIETVRGFGYRWRKD
jgi:hypothetical protein